MDNTQNDVTYEFNRYDKEVLYRKTVLMDKWMTGTATLTEKRELFVRMLISRVNDSPFTGSTWRLSNDGCLSVQNTNGNIIRVVQFGSQGEMEFVRIFENRLRNILASLQLFFTTPFRSMRPVG